MDGNPESPWNPRVPADITPAKFEQLVLAWLQRCAECEKQQIEAEHLGIVQGGGGEYKIDVLVKLTVLRKALVIVLVECKHQTRPVEREDVMVLEAKLRDVGAHKGMLFSTSGFQAGALKYADARGIATVTVVAGEWLYETKALGSRPMEPPPWTRFDAFAGIRMRPTDKGISCHTIELARMDALLEWFAETGQKP
jgi:restriction system protein